MKWDRQDLQAALITLAVITGIDYFGCLTRLVQLDLSPPYATLAGLLWWLGCCALGFTVLPLLWLRMWGLPLHLCGVRRPNWSPHLLVYPAMLCFMLPLLVYYGQDPRFQATYPFYRYAAQFPALGLLWEVVYAASFAPVEFFFRGYLIGIWQRRHGWWAVLYSTIPYVYVHHHKPFPELLASLPAGLILGTLAWRTNSIWGGVVVHVAVAMTMDGQQWLRLLQAQ